jgi:hypothetical protein
MPSPSTASPDRLVAPQPLRPVAGRPTDARETEFAWTQLPEVDGYELEVAPEADFDTPTVRAEVDGHAALTVTDALPDDGSTCYWRVRARRGDRQGPWSGVAHFIAVPDATTAAARSDAPSADRAQPSGPKPTTPTDGAPVDGQSAVFRWTPDDDASGYHLQVAPEPDFASPTVDLTVDRTTTLTLYGLLPMDGSRLHWRVRSLLAGEGTSRWSAPVALTAATDDDVISYEAEQEAKAEQEEEEQAALAKQTAAERAEAESPALSGQTPAWLSIAMAYVMVLSFLATLFLITRAL